MNLIAYGVGTQMQYVMVASAGQSDSIMQHAAGGEICQILMSRMEETGAPAAAGKVENGQKKSRSAVPFSTFLRPFSYLWDPVSVFTETEKGFFRPFSRDPVFIQNWPVFIPFFFPFSIYVRYV